MRKPLAAIMIVALCAGNAGMSPAGAEDKQQASAARSFVDIFFRALPHPRPESLRSSAGQKYVQYLPMVGRMDLHESLAEQQRARPDCNPEPPSETPLLKEIRDRAADTRVVIINEAHDQPVHRAFIAQVAAALADAGYRYFAAETFSKHVADGQQLPYARRHDGTYSNEPVFGELVRKAKQLGYTLLPYESDREWDYSEYSNAENMARRDQDQADNLAALLERHVDGRFLVHAGYSHAAEVPIMGFSEADRWMAARLKEKSGVDPLTIDQTTCRSTSEAIGRFSASAIFDDNRFDIVIGHPALEFENGRPAWRILMGQLPVDVPAELLPDNQRVIIEARNVDEPLTAVPVDRLMLWPGERLPLLLRPGEYSLRSYVEGGSAEATAQLTVPSTSR